MKGVNKFLNPKNDIAFNRIFGRLQNTDILIHFINDILQFSGGKAIANVSFLRTTKNSNSASKEQNLLHILCTDQKENQYIIEMQIAKTQGLEKRAQYYVAKAYSEQFMDDAVYEQYKKVIFIAITDFVMFTDKLTYYSSHAILNSEYKTQDLEGFSFIFLELPKFQKGIDELTNLIDKWAYFFKHAHETKEEELERIIGNDRVIERAYQELNRLNLSEEEISMYEQEEKCE